MLFTLIPVLFSTFTPYWHLSLCSPILSATPPPSEATFLVWEWDDTQESSSEAWSQLKHWGLHSKICHVQAPHSSGEKGQDEGKCGGEPQKGQHLVSFQHMHRILQRGRWPRADFMAHTDLNYFWSWHSKTPFTFIKNIGARERWCFSN